VTRVINEEDEQQHFEQRVTIATEHLSEPIGRMLQGDEVDPTAILLALAQIAGEFTAAYAIAIGHDREEVFSDVAEVMRQSGRAYHETLADVMPVAGNA
jgi:hypothetical protein